ncbi:MAG: Gfo/Idh/MocA family oxidoreductase, partial [Thermoguttaceae bacterium]|nr:Gfo/Idh/MocA family oxidoreductase [Thermoguttaceae bacterium]
MELLKIGIVGAGRLGGFHADKVAAKTNAQLVGVVDPVLETRKRIAQKYNIEHYDRIEDILPSVDAVVIAAPSVLHYELVKIALEQGKHVLVEKPMTTHGAHATELVKLAENKGLVLQTGHVEEYNPVWTAVQKWFTGIQQGKRCV